MFCTTGLLDAASDEASESDAAEVDSSVVAAMPSGKLPVKEPTHSPEDSAGNVDETASAAAQREAAWQQEAAQTILSAAADARIGPETFQLADQPHATSGTDNDSPSSGGSSPADAGVASQDQDAAAVDSPDPLPAAEPEVGSGPRRRRWRRVVPRSDAAGPATPPGTAPASPQQGTPQQRSPAQLTGEPCAVACALSLCCLRRFS